ncbi:hypothetical protein B0H17DRAFT_935549 [Mycena rosella]|uniref:Uncharacterized protein n=1 Tax=Mycena rosella TaxID=1033263 RepID=A0AAD7GJG9_MYCRO|nr:hypothetical protein B0H17DRAFT_935549 [Mycena rosella]
MPAQDFPSAALVANDAAQPFSFDVGTTIGALEISILVALFLSGMLTVQVWLYAQRSWRDPWGLKVMVRVNWIFDVGHTVAICHTLYTITIIQYGQPALLIIPPLSLDFAVLMSGFIDPLEQGWFTYRLYRLTRRRALPFLCMCLACTRFVGIIRISSIALNAYPLPEFVSRAHGLIEMVLIVGASLDAILLVALCYHLSLWRTDQSPLYVGPATRSSTHCWELGSRKC